jgi:hypothetical protein
MKRRLIAVTLLTATAVLGVPTVASASTTTHAAHHLTHVTKTNGPPMCC